MSVVILLFLLVLIGLTLALVRNRLQIVNQLNLNQSWIAGLIGGVLGGAIAGSFGGGLLQVWLMAGIGAFIGVILRQKLFQRAAAYQGSKSATGMTDESHPVIDAPAGFMEPSISILETTRSEEPLGEDHRIIDNLHSSIHLTRKFTVSKNWSQAYTVGYEHIHTEKGEFGLSVMNQVNLKLAIEQALKAQYSIAETITRTYSEEVLLDVPARTKLRVTFRWKRLWQHGVVRLQSQPGQCLEVPFQVVVGLTFDQVQTDEVG
jgi:hypothetical protein